jgi:hypothetical protein
LQNTIDATKARQQPENSNLAFMGVTPAGTFDISPELAQEMLKSINVSGKPNADVIHPYLNAKDVVQSSRTVWTIDFAVMTETEASQYEKPFAYVQQVVQPVRSQNARESYRQKWWLYAEPRPAMRSAISGLKRYIATPMVSKHRIFVWLPRNVVPANLLNVIARDDDYFFGVLHNRLHERWSIRLGSFLGVGNDPRYTPTSTFLTYPFPFPPGQEDPNDPRVQAVAAAAKTLHEARDAWLNPPDGTVSPAQLRLRTLTNLYNAIEDYRAAKAVGKAYVTQEANPASKVAEQIAALHDALDAAVLAAYGWSDLAETLRTETGEEEMLRRLLALNLARAGAAG